MESSSVANPSSLWRILWAHIFYFSFTLPLWFLTTLVFGGESKIEAAIVFETYIDRIHHRYCTLVSTYSNDEGTIEKSYWCTTLHSIVLLDRSHGIPWKFSEWTRRSQAFQAHKDQQGSESVQSFENGKHCKIEFIGSVFDEFAMHFEESWRYQSSPSWFISMHVHLGGSVVLVVRFFLFDFTPIMTLNWREGTPSVDDVHRAGLIIDGYGISLNAYRDYTSNVGLNFQFGVCFSWQRFFTPTVASSAILKLSVHSRQVVTRQLYVSLELYHLTNIHTHKRSHEQTTYLQP